MSMSNLFSRPTCFCMALKDRGYFFTIAKRWKVKQKWSAYRKPETNSDRALKYFDAYYASVFGPDRWASMRLALLCQKSYCAMVNRFGCDPKSALVDLIEAGADIVPQEVVPKSSPKVRISQESRNENVVLEHLQEEGSEFSADLPPKNQGLDSFIPSPPVVTPSDELKFDEQRLFMGNDALEDDRSFQVNMKPCSSNFEENLFPPSLQTLSFPAMEVSQFPEPSRGPDDLFSYYLLDLASVFTVLALNPKSGDRILDLCAAPGGKSLAIMQCCDPDLLVCVDKSPSRSRRLEYTLKAYLPEDEINETVEIFQGTDAVSFADHHCASFRCSSDAMAGFDKVLVDAPCLNDRISLWNDDNNWFKPSRQKERLALPEVQCEILVAAMRCCAAGGVVVYSTCTLAPGQNDGVIYAALQTAAEQFSIEAVVEDMTPFRNFITERNLLNIDASWSRYGYLVAPILMANFGPSYCCRIRRVK